MTATYIEAPEEYHGTGPSVFLAGGISGTHDWQSEAARLLADLPLTILNPRRMNYPWHEPSAAEAQITWEFRHLHRAAVVLFWLPPETLCPIALYELGGRAMVTGQPLFVGVHPDYKRRIDVEIQLKLARPEVHIVTDIPALAGQVRDWFQTQRVS